MPKKPLLFPDDVSNSEKAVYADAYAYEEYTSDYVPGYSETVKANDLAPAALSREAKEAHYQRWGTAPRKLSFEFMWLPVSDPVGRTSRRAGQDRAAFTRRGYRLCTLSDFESLQAQLPSLELPPAAHVEADGSIRREDTALHFVALDDPRYVAHQRYQEEQNRMADSIQPTVGRDSQVEIEVTDNIRKSLTHAQE